MTSWQLGFVIIVKRSHFWTELKFDGVGEANVLPSVTCVKALCNA